jgi:hypothetical protein
MLPTMMVTLYRGVSKTMAARIKKGGAHPNKSMTKVQGGKPVVFLARSPDYAAAYGDYIVEFRVPVRWIDDEDKEECTVSANIPPEMVVRVFTVDQMLKERKEGLWK